MASTKGIRAGRAFVELFADNTKLVRGLRLAKQKLTKFGSNVRNFGLKMSAVGSAVLTPLGASAKYFSSYGDQVAKMAKRTGLSVETLSELRFVASQTGTEFSSLEMAFRKMQRSIYDAGRGLSTQKDALSDLGLTFDQLKNLSPEDQFKLLADRLGKLTDDTKQAAIAQMLFGRTGTNLIPMFEAGADGIDKLQKQARKLGLTMSAEDAKAAEDFTDAMDALWKVVKMLTFNIGSALAPVLQDITEYLTQTAVKVSAWIKQNKQLVVNVAKVAAAVLAGGLALVVLGTIISSIGTVIGYLITIISGVNSVFTALGVAIGFIVSPVGAAIAAVAALGGYLVYASGVGGKAIDWLKEKFNVLKDDAIQSYTGIADALAAGDISQAARILWLTLKMEWTRGINFLEKAWLNFRKFFIQIGYDAWSGLLSIVQTIWHGLEVGWIETTAFFSKCWSGFVGFFAKTWENIKASAQKTWNWIKSLFDDSFDLKTENKLIEDERQKAIAQIDSDQKQKIADREAKRKSQRAESKQLHDLTLEEIGKQNLDKHNKLEKQYAEKIKANQSDLEAARKQWRDAIQKAKDKREAKESTPDSLDQKIKSLGNIPEYINKQATKIGVKGTFNPAAIKNMFNDDTADRTAKATEQTAKNTKQLIGMIQTNGATFA